jgi:hypothetical protein
VALITKKAFLIVGRMAISAPQTLSIAFPELAAIP